MVNTGTDLSVTVGVSLGCPEPSSVPLSHNLATPVA